MIIYGLPKDVCRFNVLFCQLSGMAAQIQQYATTVENDHTLHTHHSFAISEQSMVAEGECVCELV